MLALPSIEVDNPFAIHAALDLLTELGHKHVGFVGDPSLGDIHERRAAYEGYMADPRR